jgi:hypothetical protein
MARLEEQNEEDMDVWSIAGMRARSAEFRGHRNLGIHRDAAAGGRL